MKLEGKVAIVSGGGQGIGRGIVLCLSEEGADVAIVDINRDTAKKVADEVKALGRKSLAVVADATDSKQIDQAVQKAIGTFGKIDILVNNVGGNTEASLERTSLKFVNSKDEQCDQMYQLNLKTTVMMSRAVIPHFIKQKSGKIVNMSSFGGKVPSTIFPYYGAMKAAVIHFTKTLATELAEHNINVNCICPGLLYTPLWERLAAHFIRILPEAKGMKPRDYFFKFFVSRVPLKREQTPEDIGHAVVFLASEDAKNITGQSLNVDGGMVMD